MNFLRLQTPVAARFCVLTSLFAMGAMAQTVNVFNAASYTSSSVAPGSIVSIFGTKMTIGVAGVEDASHPPLTLRGTQVTIGGVAAALFYVSTSQINEIVATTTPLGTEAVVVTSSVGTSTGTVVVSADAAPGLFSLTGTG